MLWWEHCKMLHFIFWFWEVPITKAIPYVTFIYCRTDQQRTETAWRLINMLGSLHCQYSAPSRSVFQDCSVRERGWSTAGVSLLAASIHALTSCCIHLERSAIHQVQPLQATGGVALISTHFQLKIWALIINSISCSITSPQLHTTVSKLLFTLFLPGMKEKGLIQKRLNPSVKTQLPQTL